MKHFSTYSARNFKSLSAKLGIAEPAFAAIIRDYGYPQLHNVRPNSFKTLVHFILEQQVTAAAALSALGKLEEKAGSITPENILQLTEQDLRESYLSRQKASYVHSLAKSIVERRLDLAAFESMNNDTVRQQLIKEKGIGHWTVDVYLLFVLCRTDILPLGDLAIARSVVEIKKLPEQSSKEVMQEATKAWSPYRSIASILLWHWVIGQKAAAVGGKRMAGSKATAVAEGGKRVPAGSMARGSKTAAAAGRKKTVVATGGIPEAAAGDRTVARGSKKAAAVAPGKPVTGSKPPSAPPKPAKRLPRNT